MSADNFREVYRRTVTHELCDELHHMNIQHYYATLSEGMFNVMSIIGMPREDIPTRRTSLALYKEESQFTEELSEDDEFYMATALERVGTTSLIFQHRFLHAEDHREMFSTKFVSVMMDLEKRTSTAIPEVVKAKVVEEFPPYRET